MKRTYARLLLLAAACSAAPLAAQERAQVFRGATLLPISSAPIADGGVVRTGTDGDAALQQYTPEQIQAVDVFKGDRIQVAGHSVSVLWIRLKG